MRINLLGGPGSGKSTVAARLFSDLKGVGISIELVTEYVKTWAIQNKKINEFDQIYITGKQIWSEYKFLSYGIKNIVTDSPVILGSIYSKYYNKDVKIYDELENIALEYDKKHPCINIFLRRQNKPYHKEGRYQSYDDALKLDEIIKEKVLHLYKNSENLFFMDYNDNIGILNLVKDKTE